MNVLHANLLNETVKCELSKELMEAKLSTGEGFNDRDEDRAWKKEDTE